MIHRQGERERERKRVTVDVYVVVSVTRLDEISPLRQNFKVFGHFLSNYLVSWQNCHHTLANISYYWANFHCAIWPNIE